MEDQQIALARAAYARYGAVTDFKNFRGEPMPQYNDLPETIQQAWVAAANPIDDRHWTVKGAAFVMQALEAMPIKTQQEADMCGKYLREGLKKALDYLVTSQTTSFSKN